MEAVLRLNSEKIVYISCNPETLARDLAYLTGSGQAGKENGKAGRRSGYRVVEMTPVDMFPFTASTEVVCLLNRNGNR